MACTKCKSLCSAEGYPRVPVAGLRLGLGLDRNLGLCVCLANELVLITKEGSRGAAIDCLVTGGWVEHQVNASRVFSFIIITVKDSLLFN